MVSLLWNPKPQIPNPEVSDLKPHRFHPQQPRRVRRHRSHAVGAAALGRRPLPIRGARGFRLVSGVGLRVPGLGFRVRQIGSAGWGFELDRLPSVGFGTVGFRVGAFGFSFAVQT